MDNSATIWDDLAIISLNYNSAKEVFRQVSSLREERIPNLCFYLIDNASNDGEEVKKYCLKNGIKFVEYSYLTSKILIEYDKTKLKEQDIVNWLNKIWKIIVDNEDVYHGMSVDEVEKNVKRFYEMLKGELEGRK